MLRILLIIPFFIATQGLAQTEITWETLGDVEFSRKYFEEIDEHLYYPEFGLKVRALEGREVSLKGYILVIDPEEGFYVLSRNPFAACFFCGASGPESIVELILKPEHRKFEMDDIVTIKGKFRLNQDDINHCNYIIEDAEPVGSIE